MTSASSTWSSARHHSIDTADRRRDAQSTARPSGVSSSQGSKRSDEVPRLSRRAGGDHRIGRHEVQLDALTWRGCSGSRPLRTSKEAPDLDGPAPPALQPTAQCKAAANDICNA